MASCAMPKMQERFAMTNSTLEEGNQFRQVRHATFEQLLAIGHDVQRFEDGASPLEFGDSNLIDIPENWKFPQPMVVPKIATLKRATLFGDGSTMAQDGLYSYTDPVFLVMKSSDSDMLGLPGKSASLNEVDGRWSGKPDSARRNQSPDLSSILRRIDSNLDRAAIKFPPNHQFVPGRCFSGLAKHQNNFGHFVHDVLSRIYYEEIGAIAPGREKIIAHPFHYPIQKILFEKIFEGYEIITAPPNTALEVEELLLPANLCNYVGFNPKAIEVLSERIRPIVAPYAENRRHKICVSRSDGKFSKSRQFINLGLFDKLVEDLGYRAVEVSTMDPQTQFSLWASTSNMVGIHGAGMANMIMMPPREGRVYTEVASCNFTPDHFAARTMVTARLAIAVGHRTNVIRGLIDDSRNKPMIDLERLETVLRK